jgi:hypothetical protein
MGIDIAFGSVGLNNVVYTSGNTQRSNSSPSPSNGNSSIISVRVKKIILDNSEEDLFKRFGEWNGIGTIFWEAVDKPMPGDTYSDSLYALPILPNIKHYPLINEVVYLLQLTNTNITTEVTSNSYYYFPPLNLWNSQIHNAMPGYDNDPSNDQSQRTDYTASFQGEIRKITDNSSEIFLGKTFDERTDIHPLLPYEGDIIYEGRWGNSIRLGSTVRNSFIPNKWSNGAGGENGDPITIIRNGQSDYEGDEPWKNETEDINGDASSIYLTSNQQLPLFPSSVNNSSFSKSTPPTSTSQYEGSQIILNSNRLVLNAKLDSILLLANNSIQLSCKETLGVDAKQIALTADKIYLGSSEGTEGTSLQSAVLGENLVQQLTSLVTILKRLASSITNAVDSNGAPISDFLVVGTSMTSTCNDILSTLNKKPRDGGSVLSNKIKIKQ